MGRAMVVIEGDREIETLSARNAGVVREVLVNDGAPVKKGDLLVVVEETGES
jgi:biotin carboxyl carrier protein